MKMHHARHCLITAAAALLALGGHIQAQTITTGVPGFISYQGRVLNNTGGLVGAGTPVNRTVIFRVWDHPSNTLTGNLIYSEQQTVTISDGEFSVLVGQGVATTGSQFGYSETAKKLADIATAFGGSGRYLGVTVDDGTAAVDNEITPRQQIVSSAFSFRAKFAETLGTSASTALTVVDSGNIGVGNTNPAARFTITGANTSTGSSTPQLLITDSADSNERLRIGVDSTGNGTGFIQSFKEGTGAQNLILNPSGGNVGIGLNPPTARLDVAGGIKATGADGFTFNSGDTDGGLFSPGDGILTFRTNNAERLRVDASGNVGIGVSPVFQFHVQTPGAQTGRIHVGGTGANGDDKIVSFGDSSLVYIGEKGADDLMELRAARFFFNTGNVGIGNNNPTSKLHVEGGIRVANDNDIAGLNALIGFNDLHLSGDPGTTDLFITSGGNVGIGTVSPGTKLNVNGSTSIGFQGGAGGLLDVGIHGFTDAALNLKPRNTDNVIMNVWRRSNATGGNGGGSECFRLEDYGGAGFAVQVMQGTANKPGGGSWGAYSDARLKHDVQDLQGALDKVLQLRSVTFQYHDVPEAGGLKGTQIGFIAQEVEKVFPQWIGDSRSGYKTLGIMGFEALTVQALRELRAEKDAQISKLEAGHAALAARVKVLETAEKRSASLDAANGDLTKRLAELEAKDKARDAKLAAIEKLLLSPAAAAGKPAALPVSLNKGSGAD